MTQSISNQSQNGYGSINKIGMTNNGRVVYQVVDSTGQVAGKMSVAQKDCDTFERSYRDIMESAPQLEHYAQTTTPEQMQKKQQQAKWLIGGSGLVGGLIPLLTVKAKGGWGWGLMKQVGLTLLGTGAGLLLGIGIAAKTMMPPGSAKLAKATQNISKLDIQPVQE